MQRSVNKIVHCISLEYLMTALVSNVQSPEAQCVTSCYGTYTFGITVLLPNDEEVASSKTLD